MNRLLFVCIFLPLQLVTSAGWGQTTIHDPQRLYAVDALKADLRFLQRKLDSIHPDLYHATSKEAFSIFYDSLDRAIVRPMQAQELLGMVMLLNEKIRDGHTMFLPGEEVTAYNNTHGKSLPFSVVYTGGKLYVTENCSSDKEIQPGDELVLINDMDVQTVVQQLLRRQIRDASNTTYPLWILNHYFASYYGFVFGQSEQFALKLKDSKGRYFSTQVMPLTKDSIRLIRQRRYSSRSTLSGITLEEDTVRRTAVLTIKSFDADLLKSVYKQDFQSVTDSVFTQLHQHGIKHLIVDLRDNQGGDFETGRYLLSWLTLKSTDYLLNSKEARRIKPKAHHFTGKLYVLINGGSFSNTAIVSACLERDQRATFIGEESGGNKYVTYGEATDVVLPNTGIACYISTHAFRINKGLNNGHGIIPRHVVQPSITDLLTGKDVAMEMAMRLIAE